MKTNIVLILSLAELPSPSVHLLFPLSLHGLGAADHLILQTLKQVTVSLQTLHRRPDGLRIPQFSVYGSGLILI